MKAFFENKLNIILTCIAIVLIITGVAIGVTVGSRTNKDSEVANTEVENNQITLLCMGVDKQVAMDERHPETNSIGQADAIFLMQIDTVTKDVDIVAIPRDTIVTIEKYNHKMQYMGMEEAQICLQYAYADGMEYSSELTVDRVEELFPKTNIDAYVSINVQAIIEMNDVVGGIDVVVNDEYTATHLGIEPGSELHLEGDTAMLYLRLRDKEASGSAYTRMDRIKEYITLFIPQALSVVKENPGIIAEMYKSLQEHMVTDVELADMVELLLALKDINMENISFQTLQGEIVLGEDGYEEFYPDEQQLHTLQEKFANKSHETD